MLKTTWIRRISTLFTVGLLLCSVALPASANSALKQWEGVTASGAILTDGSSPLQVEKELLTFDLQEFPATHYGDVSEFLTYPGKVTAEYTIYNPADYTVTATFLFPFGKLPDYGVFYDKNGNLILNADAEKYTATADGQPVETHLRHSLSFPHHPFDLSTELPRISDTYLSNDTYRPHMTVTKYTYTISGVDTQKYPAATAAIDISADVTDTQFYLVDRSGFQSLPDCFRISTWVRNNGSTVTLYTFGKPPAQMPQWKLYSTGAATDKGEIGGTMTLDKTETMTLLDFALSNWSEDSGVSQVDWYNAFFTELTMNPWHPVASLDLFEHQFSMLFMRWYEYTLTLAPGQRMVHTVTAPIYPDINANYKSPVYTYTYLLSPAKTWAGFGDLDIVINTSYHVTSSSLGGFTATDTGHALSLKGLPQKELIFALSADPSPSKDMGTMLFHTLLYTLPFLLPGLVIAGILAFLAWLIKGKR